MKLCEKCVMKRSEIQQEASYSVTLTGWSRDLKLCGPCMSEESTMSTVVAYKVIQEPRRFGFTFWAIFLPIVGVIVALIRGIWFDG